MTTLKIMVCAFIHRFYSEETSYAERGGSNFTPFLHKSIFSKIEKEKTFERRAILIEYLGVLEYIRRKLNLWKFGGYAFLRITSWSIITILTLLLQSCSIQKPRIFFDLYYPLVSILDTCKYFSIHKISKRWPLESSAS